MYHVLCKHPQDHIRRALETIAGPNHRPLATQGEDPQSSRGKHPTSVLPPCLSPPFPDPLARRP